MHSWKKHCYGARGKWAIIRSCPFSTPATRVLDGLAILHGATMQKVAISSEREDDGVWGSANDVDCCENSEEVRAENESDCLATTRLHKWIVERLASIEENESTYTKEGDHLAINTASGFSIGEKNDLRGETEKDHCDSHKDKHRDESGGKCGIRFVRPISGIFTFPSNEQC